MDFEEFDRFIMEHLEIYETALSIMKVPDEVASKMPENWEKDWSPIAPGDIQVGDYIGYVAKARKYQSGTDSAGGFRKGGFITFLPDEDQSAIKGNNHKVFGFRQYSVKWTVNQDNVLMFFKTKKDTEALLSKGKEDLEEVQKITKKARTRKTVPVDEEAPVPKKTRKRKVQETE